MTIIDIFAKYFLFESQASLLFDCLGLYQTQIYSRLYVVSGRGGRGGGGRYRGGSRYRSFSSSRRPTTYYSATASGYLVYGIRQYRTRFSETTNYHPSKYMWLSDDIIKYKIKLEVIMHCYLSLPYHLHHYICVCITEGHKFYDKLLKSVENKVLRKNLSFITLLFLTLELACVLS